MQNNVHVSDDVFEAMRGAAMAQNKEVDELFEAVAERYLAQRQLDDLAALSRQHAKELGRKPPESAGFGEYRNEQQRGRGSAGLNRRAAAAGGGNSDT